MGYPIPPKRILIVDDNYEAADLIAQLLELNGYVAETAYGGAAGIEAALNFRPDVLMLDLGMPQVDGYTVAKTLRKKPDMAAVVIIAFTAWGDPDTRAKTVQAGFDHHVVKPVALDVLLSAVELSRRV